MYATTTIAAKPKHMRELPLLVNVANKISSAFASPMNSDGSADNPISSRFPSFLEKEEIEKFISDISSNIKEVERKIIPKLLFKTVLVLLG